MRVLDRIQIPTGLRQKIGEKLTPGSSLIVADKSINSAVLPEGDDFLVSAKDTRAVAEKAEAKTKHVRVAQGKTKRSNTSAPRNTLAQSNTSARKNILARRGHYARSNPSPRANTLARNSTLARRNTLAHNIWDQRLYGFNNAPEMDRPRLFFRWRLRQCGGTAC